MSDKINDNELKKPHELDIDFENNIRALNRDISKNKSVNGYYGDKNEKNMQDETHKNGFDYAKKYSQDENIDSLQGFEALGKCNDNEENTNGTKLNPRLERITEPDPDDKKQIHHHYNINRKNRNQPL